MKPATETDVVFGLHPVEEALGGRRKALRLLYRDTGGGRAQLVAEARRLGLRVEQAADNLLQRMANQGNHQGVVLELAPYTYARWNDELERWRALDTALVVVLDGVKDAGNLGAIIRTAAAAGAQAVVLPKDRAAPVTPAVVRASAGAAEMLAVCQVTNLARTLDELKDAGFWVYGLDVGGKENLYAADLKGKVVLVLGEESKGIRRLVAEHCDALYTIPMPGKFESLNVAAAAAVVIFEAVRQRAL
jgi:23S rRNA (guanosine2251-2'-O)-methyltransferase